MTSTTRFTHVAAGLLAGLAIAGGTVAVAAVASSHTRAYHGLIRGCINKRTRVVTIHGGCGRQSKAIAWNGVGPRGERGAKGSTGPEGSASAWGEVYPGTVGSIAANGPVLTIAPGGKNVLSAEYNAVGNYTLVVGGCSASSGHAVDVQADGFYDGQAGTSNDFDVPTDPVDATVTYANYTAGETVNGKTWPAKTVEIGVTVYDLKTMEPADDDLSFSVNC